MKISTKWFIIAAAFLVLIIATLLYSQHHYEIERSIEAEKRIETWYDYYYEIESDQYAGKAPYYCIYTQIRCENYYYTDQQQEKVDALESMVITKLEEMGADLDYEH